MSNIFKITEVVDMGIEKEKARRDFYDKVSKTFNEKELKDLFAKLRDWEVTHIEKFTEIKNSLEEDKTAENYPGQLTDYMQSLVDDKLYKQVSAEEFSRNIKDPIAAINYGIGFEKDAVLFFSELSKYAASSKKQAIDKLIDEEKQHIIYLINLRDKF